MPTNLQLNWTGVVFNSTPIAIVTNAMFDLGKELIEFSGDNDRFPTVIVNNVSRPKASITSGNIALLMGLSGAGTLNATQKDARGISGGDVIWTMLNSVHETTQESGQWGGFATATASFRAYSSDGSTPPLSLSRA